MTEAEWNACTDPQKMVEFLRGKVSERRPVSTLGGGSGAALIRKSIAPLVNASRARSRRAARARMAAR